MVTIEAYAMGLPVIASDVGAMKEVVENNKNGFLIKYDENFVKNSVKALLELVNNKEEAEKISQYNLKDSKKYDVKNMVKEYENLFNERKCYVKKIFD